MDERIFWWILNVPLEDQSLRLGEKCIQISSSSYRVSWNRPKWPSLNRYVTYSLLTGPTKIFSCIYILHVSFHVSSVMPSSYKLPIWRTVFIPLIYMETFIPKKYIETEFQWLSFAYKAVGAVGYRVLLNWTHSRCWWRRWRISCVFCFVLENGAVNGVMTVSSFLL